MSKNKSDLILKLFDRNITEQEFQTLQTHLREDPEMKELYYEHVMLENSLSHMFDAKILNSAGTKDRQAGKSIFKKDLKTTLLIAAACLITGLIVTQFLPTDPPPLASEIRFSQNSEWSISGDDKPKEGRLPIGRELTISRGAVELKLPRGVQAVIEAPAKLVMKNETELYLTQGRGSFTVPQQGAGFTVTTPRLQAIDLGTQFGVVSDWTTEDLVHVIQGSVSVKNTLQETKQLQASDAVSVDNEGTISPIKSRISLYQTSLPDAVKTLVEDHFELPGLEDGKKQRIIPLGWTRIGDESDGIIGLLNPIGIDLYYRHSDLIDTSETRGIIPGMKGKRFAYFYGVTTGGIERCIGHITPGSTYTMSLHLGVRRKKTRYAGYSISFVSGDTVLRSISNPSPPSQENTFKPVVLSWDSSTAPKNVLPGAPLSVKIQPYFKNTARPRYLDFDNLKVTVTTQKK